LLLKRFAEHGPGILRKTRVLYVEGDWDVEIIERLFGSALGSNNVIISKMNGVKNASLAVSSVWHRMLATPFAVMFDSLDSGRVARLWINICERLRNEPRSMVVRSLRQRVAASRNRGFEEVELWRLFLTAVECHHEGRLQFVMHGLSDIFQVFHPSLFGLAEDSWEDAGYSAGGFKSFINQRCGIDLGKGAQCRRVLERFDREQRPVESRAFEALKYALSTFVDGL
jgi:hypothetical protein